MNFYQVSLGLVVLLNLFLGIFVLTRNIKARANRIFCLFSSTIAIRGVGMLGLSLVPEGHREIALWCVPILHLGLFFAPSIFFHFVLALTGDNGRFNRRVCKTGYFLSLFFLLTDRLGFLPVTAGVTFVFGSYRVAGGPAAIFFSLFLFLLLSYGTYLLYRAYKAATSPLEKNRYRYLFSGMVVALLFVITNVMRVIGVTVYPLAHLGILFLNTMTAYAIVRYRLMDINIIRPGLVYATLTLLVTTLWLSGISLFENLFHFATLTSRILTIIVIVFLFNILREKVQFMVDRIFYRERHELFELQERVGSEIATIYDPDVLIPTVLKDIEDILHPGSLSTVLLSSDGRKVLLCKILSGGGTKAGLVIS